VNIALIGYGKMGKAIESVALSRQHTISEIVGSDNHDHFDDLISGADVAIEFTKPNAAFENIKRCIRNDIPVVSGTTGWLQHYEEVKRLVAEKNGSFFYASNFSVGVNLFFELNEVLAKMMADRNEYSVDLEEIHHTQKLDSPSGTAVTLAEGIMKFLPNKRGWVNEETSNPELISIISKRQKDIPGTHLVNYRSSIDTIEIKHTAHSREGFANGAVLAAEWLVGKKGVFGMKDMLRDV